MSKTVYYGVMTDEGVGDIIEGHDYKRENNSWYILTYVNPDKPELGCHEIECFTIFHIINNKPLYVSL